MGFLLLCVVRGGLHNLIPAPCHREARWAGHVHCVPVLVGVGAGGCYRSCCVWGDDCNTLACRASSFPQRLLVPFRRECVRSHGPALGSPCSASFKRAVGERCIEAGSVPAQLPLLHATMPALGGALNVSAWTYDASE